MLRVLVAACAALLVLAVPSQSRVRVVPEDGALAIRVTADPGTALRVVALPAGIAPRRRTVVPRSGRRTVRLPVRACGVPVRVLVKRGPRTVGKATRTVACPPEDPPGNGPPEDPPGNGEPPEDPGNGNGNGGGGEDPQAELAGFFPIPGCDFLDPAVCLLPFPNDYFTRADASTDTGRRLNLLPTATPRNVAGKPIDTSDLNRNDGFSPGTPIISRVPGLDNTEAFANSGLVPETDMARAYDPEQAALVIDADTGERQLIWAELDSTAPGDGERVLIIRPGHNLEEGHRYVVALRNLVDAGGSPIPAQRPFRVYRDRIATLDPIVEERRPHMEELFEILERAGVEREELYLAWDFTVASERDRSERILGIRDKAFAELGDTNLADLQVQGASPQFTVESVEDVPEGGIARVVTGTFTVPCFLDKPGCVPGSRFLYTTPTATVPTRIPGNVQRATFTCIVPRTALTAPARPSLYGHGLLGSQSEVEAGNVKAMAAEHNFVFCATDWYGMATEDLGSVGAMLVDLSNFPLLADRVQQGLLAQMFLGRLMVHPQGLSSHAAFQGAIDRSRLFYDGNSQGGIIGGALMAVIPDADRGVLGVPGMNYSTLLNRSVDFESDPEHPCPPQPDTLELPDIDPTDPPTDPLDLGEDLLESVGFSYSCPLYAAYPNHLDRQLLFALLQQQWDRAEANGYAHHMTGDPLANTPAHEVLMHVALGDHQVAQVAAEVEARTIGALARPQAVDPDRTHDVEPQFGIAEVTGYPFTGSALEIWDSGPVRDGGLGNGVAPVGNVPPREGRDPHSDPRSTVLARRQKSDFLRIGGQVTDHCAGGPCYSRNWKGSF